MEGPSTGSQPRCRMRAELLGSRSSLQLPSAPSSSPLSTIPCLTDGRKNPLLRRRLGGARRLGQLRAAPRPRRVIKEGEGRAGLTSGGTPRWPRLPRGRGGLRRAALPAAAPPQSRAGRAEPPKGAGSPAESGNGARPARPGAAPPRGGGGGVGRAPGPAVPASRAAAMLLWR